MLDGEPPVRRRNEEPLSDTAQLFQKRGLRRSAAGMLQHRIAKNDVELVRRERQRTPRLYASIFKPAVLLREVRAVLGADCRDLVRVGIEPLEVVGLLLSGITGDPHVENA